MSPKPSIHLYTAVSPNGHKVSITLEELGLPYEITHIDLPRLQHKEPWFLDINPNGRIPALTDVLPDGTPISLFESGSIIQYLVDRYDVDHKISYPRGTKEYYQVNNWVSLQVRVSELAYSWNNNVYSRSCSSNAQALVLCRVNYTGSAYMPTKVRTLNTRLNDTAMRRNGFTRL